MAFLGAVFMMTSAKKVDSGLWRAATHALLKAQPPESTFFRRLGVENAIAAKRFYLAFQLGYEPI